MVMLLLVAPPAAALADATTAENLYRARKWDQAAAAFVELAQAHEEAQDGAEAAEYWFKAGMSYRYWSKYDRAIDALQRAIDSGELDSETVAKAVMEQGYCHYVSRAYEAAMEKFDRALAMSEASPATLNEGAMYYGFLLNKLERHDEAIEKFEYAAQVEGIIPYKKSSALASVGSTHQRIGEWEKARAAYERAGNVEGNIGVMTTRVRNKLAELDALLADDMPFYIDPYHTRATPESVELSWVSKGPIEAAAVVVGDGAGEVELETTEIAEGGYLLHCAQVTGLAPGTRYPYSVEAAGERREGSLRTLPVRVDGPVRFSVIGDTQTRALVHERVAKNVTAHEPAFVLHVGDLVESGNHWFEWESQLFAPGAPYLRDAAIYPARGNHDGGPYFPRLFGLTERQYYSFRYGDIKVIVLDAFGPSRSGSRRERQAQWLEQELASNDATWTFVVVHDPMVNADARNKWWGEHDMLPLVQQYEVDMVFSGHHHLYRRFLPLGERGARPVWHITTGGSGGSVGGNYPSPMVARSAAVHHHLNFVVDGDRLEMTAVTIDGEVLDELTLVKTDGRYQSEVHEQAVSLSVAKALAAMGYELIVPRTDNLIEIPYDGDAPRAGEPMTVTLDLARLPAGGVDPADLPEGLELIVRQAEGNAWRIEEQVVPMSQRELAFTVTPPENVTVSEGGRWSPTMEAMLSFRLDGREFIPRRFQIRPLGD